MDCLYLAVNSYDNVYSTKFTKRAIYATYLTVHTRTCQLFEYQLTLTVVEKMTLLLLILVVFYYYSRLKGMFSIIVNFIFNL